MKPVWIILTLLLLANFPQPAPAAPTEVRRLVANGRTYLRARDWAQSRGMTCAWVVPNKSLLLTGSAARILLTLHSLEIQYGGTSVYLSHPVIERNGSLYLSQFDVDTTLAPLMRPDRLAVGARVKTICLDPGHGGRDPGNQEGSRQEKKYTLLLAQELRTQLTRLGFKVVMTRQRDAFVDLEDRPALASRHKADLFVSLHFNGTPTAKSTVRGVEVYCLTPVGAYSTNARGLGDRSVGYRGNRNDDRNILLAYCLQRSLRTGLAAEDRGVRRARFAVLRDAGMPAVLVEGGFLSHPAEGRKITTSDYRKQTARAIADGIMAYKKAVER